MAINTKSPLRPYSSTHTDNQSFDPDFQTYVYQPLGYDGRGLQRQLANNLQIQIIEDGSDTYVGLAAPGTSNSDTTWQCKKIVESGSTTTILWADGNADFDNAGTDIASLSYL